MADTKMPELDHEAYCQSLASEAVEIAIALREVDPNRTAAHLTAICARHPQRAAHLLMTLAAWVDVEGSTSVLSERAAGIAEGHIQATARRSVLGTAVA
ncbi:hypothetical protein [Nocardia sp. NPDC055049]